jgi:hypothetical protein
MIYMTQYLMFLMRADPLRGKGEEVGFWKSILFWALKWHSFRSLPFQGPEKSICTHQKHYVSGRMNHRCMHVTQLICRTAVIRYDCSVIYCTLLFNIPYCCMLFTSHSSLILWRWVDVQLKISMVIIFLLYVCISWWWLDSAWLYVSVKIGW